jgi:hypothetical protein
VHNKFIVKLPNREDFGDYLRFTQTVYNNIYSKYLDKDHRYAVTLLYDKLVLQHDLCSNLKLSSFYEVYSNSCLFQLYNYKVQQYFTFYFNKIQNAYFALTHFVNICKRKINTPFNEQDLIMDNININNSCPIFHHNKLYLFSKKDIYSMFYNSLVSSSYEFYSSPKYIKNPYTNLDFSYHHLVQLYFFYKNNSYSFSSIIESFFNCNFKINKFVTNNDTLLTKLNINRFLNNDSLNSEKIIYHIKEMIKYTNKQILKNGNRIIYCKYFPKKIYIKAFKPYLYNYLMFKNNNDQTISFDCWTKFKSKICRFNRKSPMFGRQVVRIKNNNLPLIFTNLPSGKKYYDYYTSHINYYNNEITKYDDIRPTPLNKRNYYNENDNIYSSDSDNSDHDISTPPTDSDDDGINIIINSHNIINQSESDNNIELIHQDC